MNTTLSGFGIHRSFFCNLPPQLCDLPESDMCYDFRWLLMCYGFRCLFKSTQNCRCSMVCLPTFALVWIFGITPFPHAVVPPVQTPFKCLHAAQQIARASFSNISVCFLYTFLSVLSCERDYTWVRNLLHSPVGFWLQHLSSVYLVSLVSHTHSVSHYQPLVVHDTAISASTHALRRLKGGSSLCVLQLLCVYLSFSGSTCLFFFLEKVIIFSDIGNLCWRCYNEYKKQHSVFLFLSVSDLWLSVISVMVFSVFHQSNFSHQYDNIIAYRSWYTDEDMMQEVNT